MYIQEVPELFDTLLFPAGSPSEKRKGTSTKLTDTDLEPSPKEILTKSTELASMDSTRGILTRLTDRDSEDFRKETLTRLTGQDLMAL